MGRGWESMGTVVRISAVLATACWGAVALAAAPVELQSGEESAVLTLKLSAPTAAHIFRLHQPERVVIDLPHTRPVGPLPALSASGVVTALRSGWTDRHELRVVLALSSAPTLQRQTLAAGDWELRLSLRAPASPSAPAAAPPAETAAEPAPAGIAVAAIRAPHAPHDAQRPIVIAVDAGHGGDDPGATGQGGTHEKDVTLAIARALAARIDREPGMRAVLTRDGDYFVALVERRQRARAAHADMFVSIHADAIRDREVAGASVYILSERGASSQAAKILAEEQNAADLKGGISLARQKPDLRPVLLDLSQSASMAESAEAADGVINSLDRVGAVRKREVQQAAFVVLKSPDIPSMLIETAYISNPSEERQLRSPEQQQRLADAICNGIGGYFRKYPPEGSLFARTREPTPAVSEALARDGS